MSTLKSFQRSIRAVARGFLVKKSTYFLSEGGARFFLLSARGANFFPLFYKNIIFRGEGIFFHQIAPKNLQHLFAFLTYIILLKLVPILAFSCKYPTLDLKLIIPNCYNNEQTSIFHPPFQLAYDGFSRKIIQEWLRIYRLNSSRHFQIISKIYSLKRSKISVSCELRVSSFLRYYILYVFTYNRHSRTNLFHASFPRYEVLLPSFFYILTYIPIFLYPSARSQKLENSEPKI